MELSPEHIGLVAPPFRSGDWGLVPAKTRADVEVDLRVVLSMFPKDMRDVELQLIGSFSTGAATLGSDLDVLFATADKSIRPRWYGLGKTQLPDYVAIEETLRAAQRKHGIQISVSFGPSAKSLICYSFDEDRWYGREPGTVAWKKAHFNPDTDAYELTDIAPNKARFAYADDPWN